MAFYSDVGVAGLFHDPHSRKFREEPSEGKAIFFFHSPQKSELSFGSLHKKACHN